MRRAVLASLVLCVLWIGLAGAAPCATSDPSQAALARIVVTPADAPTIKRYIASQHGKVVVVDFWATWCLNCMAEFPTVVKLQRQYAGKGLVVIGVSQDVARDVPGRVKPFLARQHATFAEFLEQADDPEDFINAFDPKWQGDLPRTFIYDRRGQLVKELPASQSEKSLAATVREVMKAK